MKESFIKKFDIVHTSYETKNPLTIGNGNFAFTCDVTGLQTFYKEYTTIPLCTLSNYHWGERNVQGELPYKAYRKASNHKIVSYMTDVSSKDYNFFRDDVFKFDIFKLVLCDKGNPVNHESITNIHQRLYLYEGRIQSEFYYKNEKIVVETKIPQNHNNLIIKIKTKFKGLSICCLFLNPDSGKHCGVGIDENYTIDETKIYRQEAIVDYAVFYKTNMKREGLSFLIENSSILMLSLDDDFEDDFAMGEYFEKAKSIDTEDDELNRRMVLSLYLMKVNTLGIYPPAETGLTCNSWYGKFHLEMHLWHHLGLIRFGLYSYVLPSLNWYLSIYESSKRRAEEQGYCGIRFPKMTDFRGLDTPSNIGCLLIWQIPHLFVILDEIMKQDIKAICLEKWLPTLKGLIDFMSSFYYLRDGKYHLDSPLIPANENVKCDCDTPIFEECYTIHAFEIFKRWKKEYHYEYDTSKIDHIIMNYAPLEIQNDCYEAYLGCSSTYTEYNFDHPMMVGMYSYFESSIVDPVIIKNTLYKIIECWNLDAVWGWDFPMLSMVANRLGDKELAIRILKMNLAKNTYLKNGHNPQLPKKELPIYLPGNGAFLLALTHIFK